MTKTLTALAFAASLHAAQLQTDVPHASAPRPSAAEIGRLSFGLDDGETPAVAPSAPVDRSTEPPMAPVGEISFDAPLHGTPEEAPSDFETCGRKSSVPPVSSM